MQQANFWQNHKRLPQALINYVSLSPYPRSLFITNSTRSHFHLTTQPPVPIIIFTYSQAQYPANRTHPQRHHTNTLCTQPSTINDPPSLWNITIQTYHPLGLCSSQTTKDKQQPTSPSPFYPHSHITPQPLPTCTSLITLPITTYLRHSLSNPLHSLITET